MGSYLHPEVIQTRSLIIIVLGTQVWRRNTFICSLAPLFTIRVCHPFLDAPGANNKLINNKQ